MIPKKRKKINTNDKKFICFKIFIKKLVKTLNFKGNFENITIKKLNCYKFTKIKKRIYNILMQ